MFLQPIKTPVLRIFVAYFMTLGSHLGEFDLTNWRCILSLLWSISLNLTVFYGLYTIDVFNHRPNVIRCITNKPLFSYFISTGSRLAFPYLFLFQSLYFLLNGKRILRIFDLDCFRVVYRSRKKAWLIFVLFTVSNHAYFGLTLYEMSTVKQLNSWPSLHEWHRFLCLYVMFNYIFWLFIILHYYQHGTLTALTTIRNTLSSSQSRTEEDNALKEIKKLALLNHELGTLLSTPTILYLFMIVFAITMNISMVLVCKARFCMILHAICSGLYAIFLLDINRRVHRTIESIFKSLQVRYRIKGKLAGASKGQPSNSSLAKPLIGRFMVTAKPVKRANNSKRHSRVICLNCMVQSRLRRRYESIRSRQIHLSQMFTLYGKYFRLRIFHLDQIDFKFIFRINLFIFAYVVLFTQTS